MSILGKAAPAYVLALLSAFGGFVVTSIHRESDGLRDRIAALESRECKP